MVHSLTWSKNTSVKSTSTVGSFGDVFRRAITKRLEVADKSSASTVISPGKSLTCLQDFLPKVASSRRQIRSFSTCDLPQKWRNPVMRKAGFSDDRGNREGMSDLIQGDDFLISDNAQRLVRLPRMLAESNTYV